MEYDFYLDFFNSLMVEVFLWEVDLQFESGGSSADALTIL